MRKLAFLLWPILSGILAAVLLLIFMPDMFQPQDNKVQFQQSGQPPEGMSGPFSYADAVEHAASSVVNIYTRTVLDKTNNQIYDDPDFRKYYDAENRRKERIQSSLGSGVILSPEGYIATNNHVITGADSIVIALKDGREATATVVGVDPDTDLAVLKIDLQNLPSVTLSSSANLRVGDVALAIGNPFGVGQTVTMGIISATGRNQLGLNTYEDFIQTDAAINPGNSGGALINAAGNLIGINTAIFSKSGGSQGIGFAIPSDQAKQVMQDLIDHGRVIRGWVGVEAQEITPELAESFGLKDTRGLIIAGVFRNGPAHKGGVLPGDILLEIGGEKVVNSYNSMYSVARMLPGTILPIKVWRNGEQVELEITVTERPASNK
ncbi:S1C family serine protease [Amphritea balenae]|uniref:PDZ domain-containing protein n=1 Tax=Amphritea balenae TaxID=452629 RepID=A0A3P1SMB5_9GAMM|nr:trypsin-like peptidase domain-containing protein [Amphritea balenae]RRC98286.1 PDZ domain-containing protein [Amphritea balenae]GGK80658.1 2-alkenal reductase [Amphritea balenae]